MQTIEVVQEYMPELLQAILEIDKESFEKQYENPEDYYREALENKNNINIILKDEEKIVGYSLAVPHNDSIEDLKKLDPEFKEDKERLYVETIAIIPEYRLRGGASKVIFAMIEEAKKRGIKKFSMHVRVKGGVSKWTQNLLGNAVTMVKRIENWPYYSNNNEPTDYMEATFE